MPQTVAALLFLSISLFGAEYRTASNGALLPDRKATPGAVRTHDSAEVCSVKTSDVRNVPESEKKAVYAAYKTVPHQGVCKGDGCEIDHLISLELGGANDITNLWPQPYSHPGAHEKDLVENWLHRQVCSGAITLSAAQREISDDWTKPYARMRNK